MGNANLEVNSLFGTGFTSPLRSGLACFMTHESHLRSGHRRLYCQHPMNRLGGLGSAVDHLLHFTMECQRENCSPPHPQGFLATKVSRQPHIRVQNGLSPRYLVDISINHSSGLHQTHWRLSISRKGRATLRPTLHPRGRGYNVLPSLFLLQPP